MDALWQVRDLVARIEEGIATRGLYILAEEDLIVLCRENTSEDEKWMAVQNFALHYGFDCQFKPQLAMAVFRKPETTNDW